MSAHACPVCDRQPQVLVAIRHAGMRRLTHELLRREHGCWDAAVLDEHETLAERLEFVWPDLLIVDDGDFPACCVAALWTFPRDRVVTIGPGPHPAYRDVALADGAGAWIPRDRIGDDLSHELRRIVGCTHCPCPLPVTASPSDRDTDTNP